MTGPDGRIQKAMTEAGLVPNSLAERLGRLLGRRVYASTTNPWVKEGGGPPGADYLTRLPEALECDGHWLLTGEGDMKRTPASMKEQGYEYIRAIVYEVEAMTPASPEELQTLAELRRNELADRIREEIAKDRSRQQG